MNRYLQLSIIVFSLLGCSRNEFIIEQIEIEKQEIEYLKVEIQHQNQINNDKESMLLYDSIDSNFEKNLRSIFDSDIVGIKDSLIEYIKFNNKYFDTPQLHPIVANYTSLLESSENLNKKELEYIYLSFNSEFFHFMDKQFTQYNYQPTIIDVIVKENKNEIKLNEIYSLEIFLNKYDTLSNPTLNIFGKTVPYENGKWNYNYVPSKKGEHQIRGVVFLPHPSGTIIVREFEESFIVR